MLIFFFPSILINNFFSSAIQNKEAGRSPSPPLVLSAYVSALLTAREHRRSPVPFWNLLPVNTVE